MDLAHARVSTTAQDLDRQIDALRDAGIAEEHIYVDKHTGANMRETVNICGSSALDSPNDQRSFASHCPGLCNPLPECGQPLLRLPGVRR
ncbi:recombinase family protein [Streptomyces sp. NPDC056982]|uniref:recombinase family protein n=1 Tax=Streptomyces sp. NPDC056982 TaxID=3345986 RepID=UPI003645A943